MKKFLALLIAVCLAFAVFTGCNSSAADTDEIAAPEETAAPAVTPAEETADTAAAEATPAVETKSVDFAALYETREPSEVVATVNGHDVTWEEYFYWLYMQANQINNYFTQMSSYYGIQYDWDEPYEEGGDTTYAQLAVENAGRMLCQLYGIEDYAAENKITLSAADEEAIAEGLKSDIAAVAGEDGAEEQFNEKLAETYLPRDLYDRISRIDRLYNAGFTAEYGENGDKISDKEAVQYLEDNGYLSANHILLMTIDPSTRESLTDEEIAEKKMEAEKIADELSAIKDPDELAKRFAELKDEYCEDTGKTAYPDGYVFTEGTMVSEFEDTVKSLKAGEVSGVVESSYGYHIIMRLADDADRTVSYSNDGSTAYSARYLAASSKYSAEVESYVEALDVKYADGFEVNITDFVK